MQIIDNKILVLRTRAPQKYEIIPKSKVIGHAGDGLYEVAVHWGMDEVRVLKNLGVRDVPSPILRAYDWPGRYTPMAHQKDCASFLTLHRRAFNFSEPGTGKTLEALWAADYLMRIGEVRRCLVLCPLSIMQSAWLQDIGNSVIHRSAVACHHSDGSRRREMIGKGYEFVIVNYDGLPIIKDAILDDGTFDMIIVDECNAYKNSTIQRWKVLNKLVGLHTYLWMMTGTPAAQSPEDAFGLAKLVNPDKVPKFFTSWRDKVMVRATRFKWVPKTDAYDKVHEALQPAIRYTKSECLDLPPVITTTRTVAMTAQQNKYYTLMRDKLVMQAAGEVVTAVNAAAGVSKLLQISAGAAYTDNREVVEFDCAPRLNVLLEVLAETNRKVLVFAMFRHNIDSICSFLVQNNIPAEKITGDVSVNKRTDIFSRFQGSLSPEEVPHKETRDTLNEMLDPRVLVIQPQAAQHGVTLTAADTVVFWGPVMSVESYIQCVARTDRKGQTSDKVTVVHLQGSPIEEKMFKRLSSKVDDHALLLDMYKEVLAA